MKRHPLILLLSALLLASPLARAGIVEAYAPNKAFLTADVWVQYHVGGAPVLSDSDSHSGVASTLGDPGYVNDVAADKSIFPTTGDAKDRAKGHVNTHFVAGAGAADDSFAFDFSGVASALTATVGGSPADAHVNLEASFGFYLDKSFAGLAVDTVVGALHFSGLRLADPGERFNLAVFEDPSTPTQTLIGALSPGDGPIDATLRIGHGYRAEFSYALLVPYSVDPPFSLGLTGLGIAAPPVPEPSMAWMLLAGGAALLARRRLG